MPDGTTGYPETVLLRLITSNVRDFILIAFLPRREPHWPPHARHAAAKGKLGWFLMPVSPGDKFGPYEITARIGEGGMGEVWKAHDSRLKRDVAIKVSAAQFSERFEREAQAIAALNHPNICQIYDVGPNYLVMEFIEGQSPKGPMPLEEAL